MLKRILYSTLNNFCILSQAAIRPPTFVFFVNDAKLFPETYRRYMEKHMRKNAGFLGTPIRLLWRSRKKSGKDEGQYLFEVVLVSMLLPSPLRFAWVIFILLLVTTHNG